MKNALTVPHNIPVIKNIGVVVKHRSRKYPNPVPNIILAITVVPSVIA
ncbi:MAG: hypothetical protein RR700_04890 [Anaerorhabdus sp.]